MLPSMMEPGHADTHAQDEMEAFDHLYLAVNVYYRNKHMKQTHI